jgi:hypothetical protein
MGSFEAKYVRHDTRFVINGTEYRSLDEMPEEYRALFRDEDRDGRPDWVQARMEQIRDGAFSARLEVRTVNGKTTYRVGDKEYGSYEELPEQYRALCEDRDGDGMPDAFTGTPNPQKLRSLADDRPQNGISARQSEVISSRRDGHAFAPAAERDDHRQFEFAGRNKSNGSFTVVPFLFLILGMVIGACLVALI